MRFEPDLSQSAPSPCSLNVVTATREETSAHNAAAAISADTTPRLARAHLVLVITSLRSNVREFGIPRDFPKKSVGIREVTGHSAPIGLDRGFDHASALRRHVREKALHIPEVADIVRERDAWKSGPA